MVRPKSPVGASESRRSVLIAGAVVLASAAQPAAGATGSSSAAGTSAELKKERIP